MSEERHRKKRVFPESFSPPNMKITGIITVDDYIAAQWLHLRPTKIVKIIFYCLLPFVLFGYGVKIVEAISEGRLTLPSLVLPGIIVGGIIYWKWGLPFKVRKIYHQYAALQKPFEMEPAEEFLWIKNEENEGQTPWAEFHKWKEGKTLFLIYRADNLFHIIPKRLLQKAEDVDTLRMILQRNIQKEVK